MSCRPAPDEVLMTRVFLAIVIAAAVSAPVVPAAQDQTFRGGIHTVSVYASVLDRAGRLVTDLTKDDFEVYDDGQEHPSHQDLVGTGRQDILLLTVLIQGAIASQSVYRSTPSMEAPVASMSIYDSDR